MWRLDFLGKFKGLGPLLLRGFVGYAFLMVHGLEKLRPGGNWDFGQAFVNGLGEPAFLGYVAAWTEFLAGFALLAGVLTRLAAVGLLLVMAYAFFKIHGDDPFQRRELAYLYGGACLAIAFVGPGPASLDRLFFGKDAVEPRR